ncbi:hypothetical protein GCM10020221_28560 [Streptomyces thioluteus]|uniref:Uncharacterized protein n=1 Tax=Streptomyces thioluteus TaxID=66431 RepID=A0ABN3WYP4_STRTU
MTVSAESIESVQQLTTVWRTLMLDRDADADVRDLPGIAVRWADSRFGFFNCITLTEAEAGAELLRHRLGQAADIMRTKKHPGFLWLFEDLLDDEARSALETTAEQAGSSTPSPVQAWPATCSHPRTGPPRPDVHPRTHRRAGPPPAAPPKPTHCAPGPTPPALSSPSPGSTPPHNASAPPGAPFADRTPPTTRPGPSEPRLSETQAKRARDRQRCRFAPASSPRALPPFRHPDVTRKAGSRLHCPSGPHSPCRRHTAGTGPYSPISRHDSMNFPCPYASWLHVTPSALPGSAPARARNP